MIYILIFFAILFFGTYIKPERSLIKADEPKKTYLWVFLGLLLLIGLRHVSVGTDSITYAYDFKMTQKESILAIFNESKEPLYMLVKMICKSVTDSYHIFFAVCAFPISLAFALFLKKYSENYFISILIFSVLGIFYFSMAGIRQTLAMGVLIWSTKFVYERRLFPFLLLCAVAYGFHNSSFVFLLVYPLANVRVDWKQWLVIAIAYILGITKNGVVMQIASLFLDDDRFSSYIDNTIESSLSLSMFYIQLVFLVFCFIFKDAVLQDSPQYKLFYNMAFIGLFFQAFTPIMGEFFRVSMYFSFALCVLVPKTIMVISNQTTRCFAHVGVAACCLAYTFLMPGGFVHTYRFLG